MAQVTFSGAKPQYTMVDPNLVRFGPIDAQQPYAWSWITPGGHDVDIVGTGLAYDPLGKAVAGKVTEIQIDTANDDFLHPDILIKGLNVDAWWLDNSPDSFWNAVLGGDDVIDGSGFAGSPLGYNALIFGDDLNSRTGTDPSSVTDRGGNDKFTLVDAQYFAMGDAYTINGGGSRDSVVVGGDDWLEASGFSTAEVTGDVYYTDYNARVEGGDDIIFDSDQGNRVTGDLAWDRGGGATVIGGNDRIFGRGGDDLLVGDVRDGRNAQITGGNDVIYGGTGKDEIWGELGSKIQYESYVSGGNDQLFGDEGDDKLYGQTGNDTLFGGLDRDLLDGGKGNDLLDGGNGDDQLFGGSGKDRLRGGLDNDQLTGGGDADVFEATGKFGRDRVHDFKNGTDRFDVDAGLTFGKLVVKSVDLDADGKADDLTIGLPGGMLEVLNTAKSAIDASDFQF